MNLLKDFKDPKLARKLSAAIADAVGDRAFSIMEVCGGQTHTIYKYKLREMLPANLRLVSGPGCPVCVTPLETIDRALAVAAMPGVIFTSFGDMLRVPGSETDLLSVKAQGGGLSLKGKLRECFPARH